MPPGLARNFAKFASFFVPVAFSAIPDDDCRRMFESIATSWKLPEGEIDALFVAGGALLNAAPEFRDVLKIVDSRLERPLPSVEQACAVLEQARQAEQD